MYWEPYLEDLKIGAAKWPQRTVEGIEDHLRMRRVRSLRRKDLC